ncbi:MAG TPA: alanine--tRNA ligase [Chthoniobacteraceae bacterium]|jgi:alanyl-tRNA synthetase
MMTSAQIRQQFLDFFREKQHTIVPSASLLPDSPNLLFTNAGMNQFVPIFLGERTPDVETWSGAIKGLPTRAADTQKCIRAGGKHNDLDDVGLDTYHHTFFEMLGNWSFGDYFKAEAIAWSWELIVERFKFPPARVYATIYQPDPGDPSERDQEAYDLWAEKFRSVGLDPAVHIVNGNKKDNFWMMGETGPCGPCSEIHIDLTPEDRTPELEWRGAGMVNAGVPECIEIWNNVFIQFNANPDGSFTPLPAQHVDTGMGFERLVSIIQGTKDFTDFAHAKISNYETDIFRPIFDELEKLSGKKYTSTLPEFARAQISNLCGSRQSLPEEPTTGRDDRSPHGLQTRAPADPAQVQIDIAFRVIADHIRTLSFAIADGIQPGNTDRNYVLRRILRRAVRYGRTLGFKEPFFFKLVAVLARTMGDVFPEIRTKQKHVEEVLKREEEAFNKTLDRGIELFDNEVFGTALVLQARAEGLSADWYSEGYTLRGDEEMPPEVDLRAVKFRGVEGSLGNRRSLEELRNGAWKSILNGVPKISGKDAFKLYDTYGFPLDLTELMARERGLTVDTAGFEKHMEEQRARARAAQKKQIIELSEVETKAPTIFLGYEQLSTSAKVLEVVALKERTAIILDSSTAYAEMGGQVGDTGELTRGAETWSIANTQKSGATWLHFLDLGSTGGSPVVSGGPPETSQKVGAIPRNTSDGPPDSTGQRPLLPIAFDTLPAPGDVVTLTVHRGRRDAIQRHHTVTHLLHWALHEVVSDEATQKGSFVGPDKLTFDFNSAALTPAQVRDIERLVNERIVENAAVSWIEVPYADVRGRADIMQFFGDKYGETVRVVQIGGSPRAIDGYSMELCAGTHTRATGEIGLFRINAEAAIAAGVRRIEAVAGINAYDLAAADAQRLLALATKIGTPLPELEKRIDSMLAQQKELERALKAAQQKEAAGRAKELLAKAETINGIPAIIANLSPADGDTLQTVADSLKGQFAGVIVLGGTANGAVSLVAAVSADFTAKVQAGKIIQTIAPRVGGKGGGKPDNARGGGKDPSQLNAALDHARALLGSG